MPINVAALRDGRIFWVVFRKRTTGETRRMRCRWGVRKHLRGGDRAFTDADANVLTVFDLDKEGYRCIPLEAVYEVHHHGAVDYGPLGEAPREAA